MDAECDGRDLVGIGGNSSSVFPIEYDDGDLAPAKIALSEVHVTQASRRRGYIIFGTRSPGAATQPRCHWLFASVPWKTERLLVANVMRTLSCWLEPMPHNFSGLTLSL